MLCELCEKNPSSASAILNGKYYKNICNDCKLSNNRVSSGHAVWSRGVDLEDHEHEIQQPYNADGSINTRFAKLYPKQAKALFTEVELRQAER